MPQPTETSSVPQIDPNLIVPTETPASTSIEAPLISPAVQAAITALAKQLNINAQTDAQNIMVVSVEAVDWPDGCLGLAPPDQMCTQVIVPGYRVLLDVDGVQYEARTSVDGGQVGLVPPR
jgi:hypothetical protein